jgi:hypothetical protein
MLTASRWHVLPPSRAYFPAGRDGVPCSGGGSVSGGVGGVREFFSEDHGRHVNPSEPGRCTRPDHQKTLDITIRTYVLCLWPNPLIAKPFLTPALRSCFDRDTKGQVYAISAQSLVLRKAPSLITFAPRRRLPRKYWTRHPLPIDVKTTLVPFPGPCHVALHLVRTSSREPHAHPATVIGFKQIGVFGPYGIESCLGSVLDISSRIEYSII